MTRYRFRGGRLTTLQQAADHVMGLPEDVQREPHWQIAVENLINAAESGGGWLMFARIAMLRALSGRKSRLAELNTRHRRLAAPRAAGCRLQLLQRGADLTNLVLSVVPMPLTAVMITMLMPAAIRAYSMAVAPHSSATNCANNRRIEKLLSTLPGISPAPYSLNPRREPLKSLLRNRLNDRLRRPRKRAGNLRYRKFTINFSRTPWSPRKIGVSRMPAQQSETSKELYRNCGRRSRGATRRRVAGDIRKPRREEVTSLR